MRSPDPHPFLAARAGAPGDEARVLVAGLPMDGGVSFRPGAADGPSGIRRFSESIESFSPRSGRDLEDLSIVDVGDLDGPVSRVEDDMDSILSAAWTASAKPLLVSLGGDHSVTPPVVRAVKKRSERLALVGFDAHLDVRESYQGDHACTYRRIAEAGVPCFVLGPRSGARAEWADANEIMHYCSPGLELPRTVWPLLEASEVYVTIDIDVLDPSCAPGIGNPEPGGPSYADLLHALEALRGLNVVAFDVVEVSPPLDPSGVTQAVAASLVREMVLRWTGI